MNSPQCREGPCNGEPSMENLPRKDNEVILKTGTRTKKLVPLPVSSILVRTGGGLRLWYNLPCGNVKDNTCKGIEQNGL